MVLKSETIVERLRKSDEDQKQLVLCPTPDLDRLEKLGTASVDLHLGTWFGVLRHTRRGSIRVNDEADEAQIIRESYVRFGDEFYLHPQSFALAVTLEWVKLPSDLAGYVIGKSTWGRRGLIIATATGVHPGFTGCITLELTNVGEVPIAINPGAPICQLFLHEASGNPSKSETHLSGQRKPILGKVSLDDLAIRLREADDI